MTLLVSFQIRASEVFRRLAVVRWEGFQKILLALLDRLVL